MDDDKLNSSGDNEVDTIKFWCSDFHISPVADIKEVLSNFREVSVIDKSLSGHCHLTNSCAVDLAVVGITFIVNMVYCSVIHFHRFFTQLPISA